MGEGEPESRGRAGGPALVPAAAAPCPQAWSGGRHTCPGRARPARTGTQASKEPGCQHRGQAGARRPRCSQSAHLPQVKSRPRRGGRPCHHQAAQRTCQGLGHRPSSKPPEVQAGKLNRLSPSNPTRGVSLRGCVPHTEAGVSSAAPLVTALRQAGQCPGTCL